MHFQMFNGVYSSGDAVLILAICIINYIVKLKSDIKKVRLFMAAAPLLPIEWQFLRNMLIRNQQLHSGMFKPAYRCDVWEQQNRLCVLLRNVGNSVTFVLATPPIEMVGRTRIEWYRGFGFMNETAWKKNKTIFINPKDPPWNMVVGSRGCELRISPITEIDLSINYFIAFAHFERGTPKREIRFQIQPMPTNLGLVYPGDTITIHMPSFMSLPAESMIYHWIMEKGRPLLPANMQPSRSGASLTISELRKGQAGVLVCGVFTNLGVFATKKRFLIRKVEAIFSQLIFEPTRPNHQYLPLDKWNMLLDNIPKIFGKRDARLLPRNIEDVEPKLLKQFLLKIPELKKYVSEKYNVTEKRLKRSLKPPGVSDYFSYSIDQQPPNANLDLPKKVVALPSVNQNLNKRKDGEFSSIDDDDQQPDPNQIDDFYLPKRETELPSIDRNINKLDDENSAISNDYQQPDTNLINNFYLLKNKPDQSSIDSSLNKRFAKHNEYQQPDTNKLNNFYFPKKETELPSIDRNLNKRVDDNSAIDADYQQPDTNLINNFYLSKNKPDQSSVDSSVNKRFAKHYDYQQPDTNKINDFYLPKEDQVPPSIDRNLNKREDDDTTAINDNNDQPKDVESEEFVTNEMLYKPATPKPRSYFGEFNKEDRAQFNAEAIEAETPPPPTKPLSFFEQRKQAIREQLYGSKARRKQAHKKKHRLRTTAETPEDTSLEPLQERDIVAMLISECERDSQCSLNANCVKRSKRKPGFCRCRPRFEGNGIFCWENGKYGK